MNGIFESKPLAWIAILVITATVGWVDLFTGHELGVFVLYFMPIGLAAWYLGLLAMIIKAMICGVFWFGADALAGHSYNSHSFAVGNTLMRLCAFFAIGWAIQRIRQLLVSEQEKSELLRRSLAELKVLKGILPICAVCKKIRDSEGVLAPNGAVYQRALRRSIQSWILSRVRQGRLGRCRLYGCR